MDRWRDEWMEEWTDGLLMHALTDARMDGWTVNPDHNEYVHCNWYFVISVERKAHIGT